METPPSQTSQRSVDHAGRASMTLEEKHEAMNSLFGMKPFKSHISKRRIEDRSPHVRQLYVTNKKAVETPPSGMCCFYAGKMHLLWF